MKLLLLIVFTLNYSIGYEQCNEQLLTILETRAKDTDTNIDWEINKHFSFYNSSCIKRGYLVVHLVGSFGNPSNNLMFPSLAANNGFHVVTLKYPNQTAVQSACEASADSDCYYNFRKEIVEGGDYSPALDVDINNSIENRLIKLLQYLEANNPNQHWGNYFNENSINWNKIIVSGHSQGGGHAAYIGMQHQVKRVLMFASPNDYSSYFNLPADWTNSDHLTPSSDYYGLNNLYDNVVNFSDQFEIWNNLDMPLSGDSLMIDYIANYSASHQLYTMVTGPDANQNHSLMIKDDQTILDANGKSVFEPVWKYMLGITEGLSIENISNNYLSIFPNPVINVLNIKGNSQLKIQILNLQGKEILFKEFHSNEISLDLSFLTSGIYILKIEFENSNVEMVKLNKVKN